MEPCGAYIDDIMTPLGRLLPPSSWVPGGRSGGVFFWRILLDLKKCNVCLSDVRFTKMFHLNREKGEEIEVCKVCFHKLYDVAMELRIHAGFLALDILRNKSASVQNDTVGRIVLQAVKG